MKKLGLIINPVAGMGGSVGLKGSDGAAIQKMARALGAEPKSQKRAIKALEAMMEIKDLFEVITYPGEMGEDVAKACGFKTKVIGNIVNGETTSEDTLAAAKDLVKEEVDLILFAGGDGTARNIYTAIGTYAMALGIPAGVKIHSAVYALSPRHAGELAAAVIKEGNIKIKEAEVMDIDEEAFREGRVSAKLYGYLNIPHEKKHVQNLKSGGEADETATIAAIASYVTKNMEKDCLYIVGSGTTTRAVMEKLDLPNTLLGIDLVYNKQLIQSDVNEKEILVALEQYPKAKIIVTSIGGQGFVFGRGNQQLSPAVIRKVKKENIMIITTKEKLNSNFREPLLVDTGDAQTDQYLCGYYKVIVGYQDMIMYQVKC